jgi:hypothetical protein
LIYSFAPTKEWLFEYVGEKRVRKPVSRTKKKTTVS